MIKEILLSLAVAAASGVSFVGSPKKLITDYSSVYGSYHFVMSQSNNDCVAETPFGNFDGEPTYDNENKEMRFDFENDQNADIRILGGWTSQYGSFSVEWFFSNAEMASDFNSHWLLPLANGETSFDSNLAYIDDSLSEPESTQEGYKVYLSFTWDEWPKETEDGFPPVYVSFDFKNPNQQFSITKSAYFCSISANPELPATFTRSQAGTLYTVRGQAFEDLAGSYGFNSSSLTLTGVTTSNFELINEIGNTGLYKGCSFSIVLPENNITIRLEAFRPSYTITATLNHCTVSPSVPSTYNGSYAEDFTFTAERGFYFNKNVAQWEFTGGVVAQEPEYIGLAWGTLYESVKIRLVFDAGNATIRVSGVAYTIDSYQQGWKDGDKSGYDRGHADGLIAGDSYGVWNWLKQAARTTGEFFNIPLLPGFSIGALLTALAGLAIIWLFIKGFLFKS